MTCLFLLILCHCRHFKITDVADIIVHIMYVTCICGQPCSLSLVTGWKAKLGSASPACQSQPRDCRASQERHCACARPCLRHIPAPVMSQQPSLPPLGCCPQEKGIPADSLEASEASRTGGDPQIHASILGLLHISSATSTLCFPFLLWRMGIITPTQLCCRDKGDVMCKALQAE